MSYYNAPFGSEDHPYCPWHGDAGVSNAPLKDECRICREMVDDEDMLEMAKDCENIRKELCE